MLDRTEAARHGGGEHLLSEAASLDTSKLMSLGSECWVNGGMCSFCQVLVARCGPRVVGGAEWTVLLCVHVRRQRHRLVGAVPSRSQFSGAGLEEARASQQNNDPVVIVWI